MFLKRVENLGCNVRLKGGEPPEFFGFVSGNCCCCTASTASTKRQAEPFVYVQRQCPFRKPEAEGKSAS